MPQAAVPLLTAGVSAASGALQTSSRNRQISDEQARRAEIAAILQDPTEALEAAGIDLREATGRRPDPVTYTPLSSSDPGYYQQMKQVLEANTRNSGRAKTLSQAISRAITSVMKDRVQAFDPLFLQTLKKAGQNANMMTSGQLPYQDALDIVSGQGNLAPLMGTAGGRRPQTYRDLGLSRLQLMSQGGPQLLAQVTDIIGAVDPVQLRQGALPQNYMLTPAQTVPMNVQQNQYGAQFQQGQNFLAAMPDPLMATRLNMFQQGLGFMAAPVGQPASVGASALQGAFSSLPQAFPNAFGTPQPAAAVPAYYDQTHGPVYQAQPFQPAQQGGGNFFSNLLN